MSDPVPASRFRLSSAVFIERDGKILILQRAMGEAIGGWYLPGGALDAGETIEDCARREVREECGLEIAGSLTCVAVAHLHVYGEDSLQVLYACECQDGDVTISAERSGFRWLDAAAFRDRYFADNVIAIAEAREARFGAMMRNIRDAINAYIAWRSRTPAGG